MNKRAVTAIAITVLLILFSIALGTVVMNLGANTLEYTAEDTSITSICDPLTTLKMKYVNNEITAEEYDLMKAKLQNGNGETQ